MGQFAPWLLVIAGVILLIVGLFSGWNGSSKGYLLMGMTCVLLAGAFLLLDSRSALGTPAIFVSGAWIVGVLVATRKVAMRGVLRDARSELLFGGITTVALLAFKFLPPSAPHAVRIALVVAIIIFTVSFLAATFMRVRGRDIVGRSSHSRTGGN